jgi:hypothetical protein
MGSHVGASTALSEKDRSDESRRNAGLKTHMFLLFWLPVSNERRVLADYCLLGPRSFRACS